MPAPDGHRALPYGIAPAGYRLPADTRVGAGRLQVSDLGRSIEYYRELIGLAVHAETATSAALGPHDDDRALVHLEAPGNVRPSRKGAFGLFHFAILLPDRSALGRFTAHLGRRGLPLGAADHGVSEALYLWDPDGLGIEVYADRPSEAWEQRDGQLMMTTDPLDLVALAAAGGDTPWKGMPAGTTMGHVHLHVGDLDDAEAFFHRTLGLDKTMWDYPGALFLSAGGYHHHLGTNTWSRGPSPDPADARLLDWELRVPSAEDAAAVARSLRDAGHDVARTSSDVTVADPWGTTLRVTAAS